MAATNDDSRNTGAYIVLQTAEVAVVKTTSAVI